MWICHKYLISLAKSRFQMNLESRESQIASVQHDFEEAFVHFGTVLQVNAADEDVACIGFHHVQQDCDIDHLGASCVPVVEAAYGSLSYVFVETRSSYAENMSLVKTDCGHLLDNANVGELHQIFPFGLDLLPYRWFLLLQHAEVKHIRSVIDFDGHMVDAFLGHVHVHGKDYEEGSASHEYLVQNHQLHEVATIQLFVSVD
jgi:hypothetical protein